RKKRRESDKTKAQLFSFEKGMGQLSESLAAILAERIQRESIIENLTAAEDSCVLHYSRAVKKVKVRAKSLIFTTPAYVTAEYLRPFDEWVARRLDDIAYAPVAVVFLGFKNRVPCRPLDGFGFLVPEIEDRKILGAIWSSTIFPNRAPASGMALTTFVGGMRQPELAEMSDVELSNLVLNELKDLMGLAGKPDVVKLKRWQRAIPQYEVGHQKRMDAIAKFESEHPGVFISGSFRNGISVGDCILQSESVADKVQQFCQRSQLPAKVSENLTV
ncbi:MAG: protoporphyrinogen oxidase, partial [bacterium]